MAQLNTSLSDMPWFGQPADPGASLARGVASGAQIANVQHQRASLAQQKMEFDQLQALRESQESRTAQLFPLIKTLQQQEVAMKTAQVEDFLRIRQETVEDAGTVGILRQMAGDEMKKGNWMAAMDVVNSGAAQLNRLIDNPQFQQLQKDIAAKANLLMQQQHMNNEAQRYSGAGSTFKPGFGVDINPITKEPMAYFRTGEGSAKLIEPSDTQAKPLSTLGKLLSDRNLAQRAGRTDEVQAYDAEIEMRRAKEGFELVTNPDGTFTLRQGAKPGKDDMSVQEKNTFSAELNGADAALSTLGQMREQLKNNVGMIPSVQSVVMDVLLANVDPRFADEARIKARTMVKSTPQEILGVLGNKVRMSNVELKRIEDILPKTGFFESVPAAEYATDQITAVIAEKAARAATALKRPVPLSAVSALAKTPEVELLKHVNNGWLSEEAFMEVARFNRKVGKYAR